MDLHGAAIAAGIGLASVGLAFRAAAVFALIPEEVWKWIVQAGYKRAGW